MLDDAASGTVDETRVPIRQYADVVVACQEGWTLAAQLGLSDDEQIAVLFAILEVGRSVIRYAGRGEIVLRPLQQGSKRSILVEADGTSERMIVERHEVPGRGEHAISSRGKRR